MRNELNNLVQYFCMYPGGNANDFVGTIKPHAEKLAHPNLTIHTAKGTMNKEQWLAFLESFANGGGMAEPLSFKGGYRYSEYHLQSQVDFPRRQCGDS